MEFELQILDIGSTIKYKVETDDYASFHLRLLHAPSGMCPPQSLKLRKEGRKWKLNPYESHSTQKLICRRIDTWIYTNMHL